MFGVEVEECCESETVEWTMLAVRTARVGLEHCDMRKGLLLPRGN